MADREILIDYGFYGYIVQVKTRDNIFEQITGTNALGLSFSISSQHHPLYISEDCLAGYARYQAGQLCIKHAIDGYRRVEGLYDKTIQP